MIRAALGFLLAIATLATAVSSAWAGQFKKSAYYHAGQLPRHVAAAQLTRSGNVDLVFADYLSNQVVTVLGNGDGTFQKPVQFPALSPISLVVGDFDEDGNQDLAVLETSIGNGNGSIVIFLGDGTGHFKLSATYPTGAEPLSITAADFTGDGHLDLAVAHNEAGIVMVFFGTGKGTFHKRATYKVAGQASGIAAGDLNGDGYPDLAITTYQAGKSVATFMNDGTGKFGNRTYYRVDGWPTEIRIADLRNNGMQDLIVADTELGMDVWLNHGDGTFGQPTIYVPMFSGAEAPEDCTVADFNLDGNLDVACATNLDDSYFFYGKGDGTFGSAIQIADTLHGQGGFSIASGDFNNDGSPDLAIPIENYGQVAIMLNTK